MGQFGEVKRDEDGKNKAETLRKNLGSEKGRRLQNVFGGPRERRKKGGGDTSRDGGKKGSATDCTIASQKTPGQEKQPGLYPGREGKGREAGCEGSLPYEKIKEKGLRKRERGGKTAEKKTTAPWAKHLKGDEPRNSE